MDPSIRFDNVSYTYQPGTPFSFQALKDISVSIPQGKVTAIIGHTGSGKSTFIQHLNLLLRPTEGTLHLFGETFTDESKHGSLKWLRQKVGVVFQFPEAQLFEETVLKDVMFGPLNFGVPEEEAEAVAREKLRLVGLQEEVYERSPFDLSGGQMRRVAIAGVLAQNPEVLVLDEPTAGLDPKGQKQMLEMFMTLQKDEQLTVIMVTHQMEDVAHYADHVIVFEKGEIARKGTPAEIFKEADWLRSKQLGLPEAIRFMEKVDQALDRPLELSDEMPLTAEGVADVLVQHLKEPMEVEESV